MPGRLDAVVIGGGPAGAAIGRLLSAWGHSVRVLTKRADVSRGLGESLPPSSRKLLHAIGVLDAVERAGFYRTSGNTVWWASGERRVERFDAAGRLLGYQVHRPALDHVLLDCARSAGASVDDDATVRAVRIEAEGVDVEYDCRGAHETASARFVVDCSGRAGVIAKQYRVLEPGHRMYALVGVWDDDGSGPDDQPLVDPTHTVVETYQDGWAWSVPISASTRHAGFMIDGTSPRSISGRALTDAYRVELAKTSQMRRLFEQASLDRVWACDASLYSSRVFAGPRFLLAGDAASFIDPLSSFGVKKALASAWVGAIVVHTCLEHPERQTAAFDFFTQWEERAYAAHLRRSRAFADAARGQHPHAFWALRAEGDAADEDEESAAMRDPAVQAAFAMLKEAPRLALMRAPSARIEPRPVIRGREIVLEDTFAGLRFFRNVDLLKLADVACRHGSAPDVFDAYCAADATVPLPNVLGGLSLLIAKGILQPLPKTARR
jgi:flavin-dependent dehydrogenase